MNDNSLKHNILKFSGFFFLTVLFAQLSPFISFMGIMPNIAFILVMCGTFIENDDSNLVYALIFGIITDYMNGRIFGVYMLLFVVLSFCFGEIYHRYFENMTFVEICFLVFSFILYSFLIAAFFGLSEGDFGGILLRISLVETAYNTVLGIIIFIIYKKIMNAPAKRRRSNAWRV